ncbi:symmetrical bis(5'-nucleosyl)-tetraphosphatase [Candidatus Nitrospira bockiana]
MATYAIGDVQGCWTALERLIAHIGFTPDRDRLWFVGDLVNRGPQSHSVLRFVKDLGAAAITVLGNHDLHLLAVASGAVPPRGKDTFTDILEAPDRNELIAWLGHRPLLHREIRDRRDWLLVHAGLVPQWTARQVEGYAREIERALRSDEQSALLRLIYDDGAPTAWSEDLSGLTRLAFVARALTRLRVCSLTGEMNLSFKRTLDDIPPGFVPWFQVPGRRSADATIVFGHWAALGLYVHDDVIGLDSGCVWGRSLTALRLEDRKVFQVSCDK